MTESLTPSRDRLTELFLSLARIPSPSRHERAVADVVIRHLMELGLSVHEDEAGNAIEGDTGNLWCLVPGDGPDPHVAFGTHLDTVFCNGPIEPILDSDGVFRSASGTILGADDKVAVAAVLHATELLKESGRPFPSYELFFTVAEEVGLLGSRHMDERALRSPMAAVLDSSGPVGGMVVRAPSQESLHATFRGLAAHAGLEPERGRSAIQAAAMAVAGMQLGRLDDETSANIGVIRGGTAGNIIPDLCEIEGECRSHNDEKLTRVAASMVDAIQQAAAQTGVDVDVDLVHEYRSFALTSDSPAVRLGKAGISAIGLEAEIHSSGGGSDANVLNARGLPSINLQTGMMRVHSSDEYVTLDDLERLCALLLKLVELAPDFAPKAGAAQVDL
ncbi:MAG: M20/M25/M40 family metallo-hydrolase [Actinobacteria bacterium]|nr:M20/M25/M40 family metallo-hydrolase [Actinomycetota bacterium]